MCALVQNSSNIYILYGDEPYLVDIRKKQLMGVIPLPELNLGKFDGWSDDVIRFLSTYPIGDTLKVAIAVTDNVKSLGKGFEKYLEHPISSARLIVVAETLDKRSTIYKTLSKKEGVLVECNKIKDIKVVQKIILAEVQRLGGRITEDAYGLFVKKENYGEDGIDISMLNVLSDLRRLVAYNSEITVETVNLLIHDNISAKVFSIAKFLQDEDVEKLHQQAELLSDNAIGTLSALLREYRIAWKVKYFDKAEIGAKYVSFARLPEQELLDGTETIMSSIDGIKNGSIPKDTVLHYCFMQLLYLHKQYQEVA